MTEYIEREAALSAQNKSMNLAECRKRLERLPAADVVPVVRCGECKYWKKYDNTAGCGYCHAVKFEYGAYGYTFHPVREPGFFCADGERKDGG